MIKIGRMQSDRFIFDTNDLNANVYTNFLLIVYNLEKNI